MTELKKIKWESKYSVDIDELDEYQKKMFALFNDLIDLKKGRMDAKECSNKISAINEYAKMYFGAEEKILKKKEYPDFQNHSKAHRQFIKSSISLRREIADDISNLTDDVIVELRDWIINHIVTMDALFVPFVRINNYITASKQKS